MTRVTEAPNDPLTMDIVASDPWDFVGSDGSNVFRAVSASRRISANEDVFPWVLDFGDRLGSHRFFAMSLSAERQTGLLQGDTVECSLVSLQDVQGDPEQWRGGRAARCTARLV